MTPERILIVVTASLTDLEVRAAVEDEDLSGAEVRVLAPAVNRSALAYWVSDPDAAIAEAEGAATVAASAAREEDGVGTVTTEAGESDPAEAIENALRTFPADRVLVVHRAGDDAAYREDQLDAGELQARLGRPVTERALAPPEQPSSVSAAGVRTTGVRGSTRVRAGTVSHMNPSHDDPPVRPGDTDAPHPRPADPEPDTGNQLPEEQPEPVTSRDGEPPAAS